MFGIKTLLILIPALPLAATLLTAVLGKRVLRERSHLPAVTALMMSFIASVVLLFQVQQQVEWTAKQDRDALPLMYEDAVTLWRWADVSEKQPVATGSRSTMRPKTPGG